MSSALPIGPEDERLLRAAMERQSARINEEKNETDPVLAEVRNNIRFRLLGYALDDSVIPWQYDVKHVRNLERKLVVDPKELKREFAVMREKRPLIDTDEAMHAHTILHTKFAAEGGHISLNSKNIIYRARREGWVLLAGLQGQDGVFHTLGYNYGLDTMPDDEEELRNLAKNTLSGDDKLKKDVVPEKTAVNWRTGITGRIESGVLEKIGIDAGPDGVSARRIGIASALKYILTSIAQKNRKEKITFNIGTLNDITPGSEEMIRNTPSFHHNTRIFREDMGYRQYTSDIVIKGALGERERVAMVRWRARWDKVSEAFKALQSDDGVLHAKGWDIDALEERAAHFHSLIQTEKNEGSHL